MTVEIFHYCGVEGILEIETERLKLNWTTCLSYFESGHSKTKDQPSAFANLMRDVKRAVFFNLCGIY